MFHELYTAILCTQSTYAKLFFEVYRGERRVRGGVRGDERGEESILNNFTAISTTARSAATDSATPTLPLPRARMVLPIPLPTTTTTTPTPPLPPPSKTRIVPATMCVSAVRWTFCLNRYVFLPLFPSSLDLTIR